MLEEMVVSATVKPTDCEFTSQKDTSLPQVFDRGRKAMQAAETVQRMLAAVAVSKRAVSNDQHGTLKAMGAGSKAYNWGRSG